MNKVNKFDCVYLRCEFCNVKFSGPRVNNICVPCDKKLLARQWSERDKVKSPIRKCRYCKKEINKDSPSYWVCTDHREDQRHFLNHHTDNYDYGVFVDESMVN